MNPQEPCENGSFWVMPTQCIDSLTHSLGVSPNGVVPGVFSLCIGRMMDIKVTQVHKLRGSSLYYEVFLDFKEKGEDIMHTPGVHLNVRIPQPKGPRLQYKLHWGQPRQFTNGLPVVSMQSDTTVEFITLHQIWAFAYVLFSLWPTQEYIALDAHKSVARHTWLLPLLQSGLVQQWTRSVYTEANYKHHVLLSRTKFWQGAGPLPVGGWIPTLVGLELSGYPTKAPEEDFIPDVSNEVLCTGDAQRGLKSWRNLRRKTLYKRLVPFINKMLTFRLMDFNLESDRSIYGGCTGSSCEYYPSSHFADFKDLNVIPSDSYLACELDGTCFAYAQVKLGGKITASSTQSEIRQSSIERVKLFKHADISPEIRLEWIRSLLHVREIFMTLTNSTFFWPINLL